MKTILTILFLGLFLQRMPGQTTDHSFLTNGLVAYYPFNGNAQDASGHSHHGTVHGTMLTTNRFDKTNQAYYFDGDNAYIELPQTIGLSGASTLTISLWLNASLIRGRDFLVQHMINYPFGGVPAFNSGFFISLELNGSIFLEFRFFNTDTTLVIGTNQWYHMVVSYAGNDSDPTKRLIAYLNGRKVPLTAPGGPPSSLPDASLINRTLLGAEGNSSGSVGSFFTGVMDDVRIYNRAFRGFLLL